MKETNKSGPTRLPSKGDERLKTKLKTLMVMGLISVLISGCATSSCVGFKPIRPSKSDVLTESTKIQILENNEFGSRHCGWK